MATHVKPSRTAALPGATTALVLLTAMNFVNYLDRYILPAVQEQVKGEFHLSDDQIGSLTMFFMFAYVLSSPLTGWLGDRFPRKPMIVAAGLGIAAMNFFTASVHSYLSLNLRHAALGVAEASFGIFAPALLADFFSEDQRNKVLTIFNMALPFGAACSYEGGAWIAEHYGWRMSFMMSAIPGAAVGLLIWMLMREPKRTGSVSPTSQNRDAGHLRTTLIKKMWLWIVSIYDVLRILITNKAYLTSIMGYAAVTFSLGGISWWMPSFLQREAGYSMQAAGSVMGPIIVIAGLGGTALGGWLAQWWSKRTEKALYYVPALGSLLAVPPALICFFGPAHLLVPSLYVAVFLIFLGTGPVNAAALNAVPANLRAMAMAGQLFAIHVFGDAFSPKLIGMVSDHSNLRYGLGLTLFTFLIASVIFFVGARYAPKLHRTVEPANAA